MNKTISVRRANGGHSWFSDAIGGAWRLVKQSTHIPTATNSPLYAELCALSEQHLPVLVHKRAKYLKETGTPKSARWTAELDEFVIRTIWPYLFDVPSMAAVNTRSVAKMLDEIIRAEQRRAAAATPNADMPHTSRFDTSWVT